MKSSSGKGLNQATFQATFLNQMAYIIIEHIFHHLLKTYFFKLNAFIVSSPNLFYKAGIWIKQTTVIEGHVFKC